MASRTAKKSEQRLGSFEGRLELTWTNKPLSFLPKRTAPTVGSPSDYRVAEVRLLEDVSRL